VSSDYYSNVSTIKV